MTTKVVSDIFAMIVGYTVIVGSIFFVACRVSWWLVGRVIKMLGRWPLFIDTLGEVGRRRHERSR